MSVAVIAKWLSRNELSAQDYSRVSRDRSCEVLDTIATCGHNYWPEAKCFKAFGAHLEVRQFKTHIPHTGEEG